MHEMPNSEQVSLGKKGERRAKQSTSCGEKNLDGVIHNKFKTHECVGGQR